MTTMLQLCDTDQPAGLLLWSPPEPVESKFESDAFSTGDITLNVLTLYSASVAADHSRFNGFLQDLFGIYCELQGSALCFEDFESRPPMIDRTDIVLLIASDERESIPPKVRKWLSCWLAQAGGDSAVICLLAHGTYRETGMWHGVHRACDAAGVAFFATGFEPDAACPNPRFTSPEPWSPAHEPSCGVAHWGINE
jgi:hypothetical protein